MRKRQRADRTRTAAEKSSAVVIGRTRGVRRNATETWGGTTGDQRTDDGRSTANGLAALYHALTMVVWKLRPRLVPEPLWGLSGRRLLKRSVWERLRGTILLASRSTCAVCGVSRESRMVCDEEWSYDDDNGRSVLTGLRILCPDCDAVNHLGQTSLRGHADEAYEHMAHINGCSVEEAMAAAAEDFETWHRRSERSWSVSVLPGVLAMYPELAVLDGLGAEPGAGGDAVDRRLSKGGPAKA